MSDKVEQLFQDAMEALEAGKREDAAELLKQAVEEDPENVDAWIALSEALDDIDEKRIALTTILQLDPDNSYAQDALQKTEEKETAQKDQQEVVPGITRQRARTTALGLLAYTLVACGLAFAITSSITGGREAQANQVATEAAAPGETQTAIAANATQVAAEASEEAFFATETAIATITPTVTPTSTLDLPPTATATIVVTEVPSARVQPPPPIEVAGDIYAWGGRNNSSRDYLELRRYQVNNEGSYEVVNDDLAQNPQVDSAGQRLFYERFVPQGIQDAAEVYQVSLNTPTDPGRSFLSFYAADVFAMSDLDVALDASALVFTGESTRTTLDEIYFFNLTTTAFTQITSDGATYSDPTISPDGTKIIVVRTDDNGADLVLFDVSSLNTASEATAEPGGESLSFTPMTEDNNTVIESEPIFSPDGTQVAFTATGANGVDIYILQLNGTTSAGTVALLTAPAAESHPVFSPDGRYIAYASDESGVTNIFVYDLTTATVYQVSESELDPVFPGDWAQ